MGTFDAIYNNDTAMDLNSEYRIAFGKYPAEEAVKRLDEYVRSEYGNDEQDWTSYVISLGLFVHKYGIHHPAAIARSIKAIDNIGSLYGEEFSKRDYRKLWNIRERLLKPQSDPKRNSMPKCTIPPNLQIGDVISLAVNSTLQGREGKRYILLQKVGECLSWKSAFDPAVRNVAPVFMLFDFFEKNPPKLVDVNHVRCKGIFTGIGNQRDYIRRELSILGHLPVERQYSRTSHFLYVLSKEGSAICELFE